MVELQIKLQTSLNRVHASVNNLISLQVFIKEGKFLADQLIFHGALQLISINVNSYENRESHWDIDYLVEVSGTTAMLTR